VTKEKLKSYCDQKGIFVPPGATVEYLNAAIVRTALHDGKIDAKSCFGFWDSEDPACLTCDQEKICFRVAMGMEKEEYFKKLHNSESPRLRVGKKKLK